VVLGHASSGAWWPHCLRILRLYCPAHGRSATARVLGLEPTPVTIDRGASARFETPPPGPTGVDVRGTVSPARSPGGSTLGDVAAETIGSLNDAIASFRRSENWSKLQPIVFHVVGHHSFGLGVVYGIGENVIGSVVELAQLAKTFLLADLYDRAHQSASSAAFGPFATIQRLMAEVAMRAFGNALEEARRERDELIAELRFAVTHLGEVVGNLSLWGEGTRDQPVLDTNAPCRPASVHHRQRAEPGMGKHNGAYSNTQGSTRNHSL
jgi:hypothetical protein